MMSFILRKQHIPWQWSAKKVHPCAAGRDNQPEYFLDFLRMCEAHGHHRSKGQTLMDFHRHLKYFQFCDDHFDDIVVHYYKSRYENTPER